MAVPSVICYFKRKTLISFHLSSSRVDIIRSGTDNLICRTCKSGTLYISNLSPGFFPRKKKLYFGLFPKTVTRTMMLSQSTKFQRLFHFFEKERRRKKQLRMNDLVDCSIFLVLFLLVVAKPQATI